MFRILGFRMVQGVGLRLRGQSARIRLGYIEGPACGLGLFLESVQATGVIVF